MKGACDKYVKFTSFIPIPLSEIWQSIRHTWEEFYFCFWSESIVGINEILRNITWNAYWLQTIWGTGSAFFLFSLELIPNLLVPPAFLKLLCYTGPEIGLICNWMKLQYKWNTPLNTGCIKMIGAVLKLIIFTSTVNRIINTSRNERVTQQVYDTYLQMFDVCTLRHTAHIEAIVQFLPYSA